MLTDELPATPWGLAEPVDDCASWGILDANEDTVIAEVIGHMNGVGGKDLHPEKVEAIAHLMAAAPLLYAVLLDVVEAYTTGRGSDELLDRATAALRAANYRHQKGG